MIDNKALKKWELENSRRKFPDLEIPFQDGLPHELTLKQGVHKIPDIYVARVPDVIYTAPIGAGFYSGDAVLETAWCGRIDVLLRNMPYVEMAASHLRDTLPVELSKVFPMIGVWSDQYFHWVTEFFPKIWSLIAYMGETDDRDVFILLQKDPPFFVTEMLDLINLPVRYYFEETVYQAETSILVTTNRHNGITNPGCVEWVRNTFRGIVPPVLGGAKKIWVSRRNNQRARRVVNEDELLPVLADRGFSVIAPDEWSVAEQIAMFQAAHVIVGPHGGGLTNMIYADSPRVHEFFAPSYINPCFYALAKGIGSEYSCSMGELIGEEDIRIDPKELDNILERIG